MHRRKRRFVKMDPSDDSDNSESKFPVQHKRLNVSNVQSHLELSSNHPNINTPPRLQEYQSNPEYQSVLKEIKFTIETMNRSQLEQFCFSKVKSEIENKSLYEIQLKELQRITLKLLIAKQSLDSCTCGMANQKLTNSKNVSVQVKYEDILQECSSDNIIKNVPNQPASTPNLSIKVKDISKLRNSPTNTQNSSTTNNFLQKAGNSNKSMYVLFPYLSDNNNVPMLMSESLNKTFIPSTLPMVQNPAVEYFPIDVPIDTNSTLNNITCNKGHLDIKPEITNLDPGNDIDKSSSALESINKSYDDGKEMDIEDSLPHALITLNSKPVDKNSDSSKINVFRVVKTVDLTEDKTVAANKNDTGLESNMPFIVSAVSLASASNAEQVQSSSETSNLPVIISTHSLAPNIITNTSHNQNEVTQKSHNDTSTIDDSLNLHMESKLAKIKSCDPKHNLLWSHLSNSNQLTNTSKSSETPSPTIQAPPYIIKKGNFGIIRPGSQIEPDQTVTLPTISSTSQILPNVSSTQYILPKVPSTQPPQVTTRTLSIVTSQISPSPAPPTVTTANQTKASSTMLPKESSEESIQLDSNHIYDLIENDSGDDVSNSHPQNDMDEDVLKNLGDKIIDRLEKSYLSGNFPRGISIKIDFNGIIKIVTCTITNAPSMKKVFRQPDREKHFFKFFASAIIHKIKETVGVNVSGQIRKFDILDDLRETL